MADDVSITRTTRIEKTTGEPTELKERLSSVQDQLRQVEDQVRADAESLQKLRQMLDVSYLEEITSLISDLEMRVQDVADEADRARRRAEEAEKALHEEQERLEKLWDVYKVQETEVEKLRGEKEDLTHEITDAKNKVRELESAAEAERRALRQAQAENGDLRQRLADAEATAEDLKAYEELNESVGKLESQLNEERERLAKLYAVYEETQAERDDASARIKQWEAWWQSHNGSLKGVQKAVNEAPVR